MKVTLSCQGHCRGTVQN